MPATHSFPELHIISGVGTNPEPGVVERSARAARRYVGRAERKVVLHGTAEEKLVDAVMSRLWSVARARRRRRVEAAPTIDHDGSGALRTGAGMSAANDVPALSATSAIPVRRLFMIAPIENSMLTS